MNQFSSTALGALSLGLMACQPKLCEYSDFQTSVYASQDELVSTYGQETWDEYFPEASPIDGIHSSISDLGYGQCVGAVTLSAVWCEPCWDLKPIFDDLSSQFPRVHFMRTEEEEGQKAMDFYGSPRWLQDDLTYNYHPNLLDESGNLRPETEWSLTFPTTFLVRLMKNEGEILPTYYLFSPYDEEGRPQIDQALDHLMGETPGYRDEY